MKSRGNKSVNKTLEYLYNISLKLPYQELSSLKCKEFLEISSKNQVKLKKLKRTICFNCKTILVPKVNSSVSYIRKENGFGLQIVCMKCKNEKFIVLRGV